MFKIRDSKKEKGVALVFALLILLVLTILGVASMGNTAMQERMTGNANLQALAFQAASSGVPGAIAFGTNQINWGGNTSCAGEWKGDWSPWTLVISTSGVNAEFRRQVRCIQDEELMALGVSDIRSQLYVRTEGRVVRPGPGINRALSTRQVEVLIDRRGGVTESAIRVEGSARVTADTPNSANFLVDGGTQGVSISASTIENRDIIRTSVHKNRVNQYKPNPPGIVQSDYESPWNDPVALAELMNELRGNLIACSEGGAGVVAGQKCTIDDSVTVDFDRAKCRYYAGNESRSGEGSGLGVESPGDFGLHFVDGNLDLGGRSDNFGLIISTGFFDMSGNANLTGKAIALGGRFKLYGGGGEESKGSIFLTNLDLDASDPAFGSSDLDLSGGGDHQVYYDCEKAKQALELFGRCGVNNLPPVPVCTGDGEGGGVRDVMASWRENFGWREDR